MDNSNLYPCLFFEKKKKKKEGKSKLENDVDFHVSLHDCVSPLIWRTTASHVITTPNT